MKLADACGCDERSVRRARDSGRLPRELFVRRGRYWKLRADRFEIALRCMGDLVYGSTPTATGDSPATNGGFDYPEERARREHYEAELARLRLADRIASLVSAADVRRVYTAAVRQTTARMMRVPRQLAAEVSGSTPAEAEQLLDAAIRTALDELKADAA